MPISKFLGLGYETKYFSDYINDLLDTIDSKHANSVKELCYAESNRQVIHL